jgi:glycosyltransferase involved in cell wall biosynthesis
LHKLKVAIDCRIEDPRQGIGTAFLALAHGLSTLQNIDQEYTFIVFEHVAEWLRPNVPGSRIIALPSTSQSKLRALAARRPALRFLWKTILAPLFRILQFKKRERVPASDGLVESEGFDVIHFPTQIAYTTRLPSIYQPWDLQHLHYPEFFSDEEIRLRELSYRVYCGQATFVCVPTEWGKQDLVRQYGVAPEKVKVVPFGTAFEVYTPLGPKSIAKCLAELNLPEHFFVYPAATWPHKNHEVILRALALIKQRHGIAPHVVFTGQLLAFHKTLASLVKSLDMSQYVHFLGFITSNQIQAIYQTALGMIFPSKFEGLGLPVLEAFRAGLPVLCSNATVLPEVAGDAASYFDPESPQQLADLIEVFQSSADYRYALVQSGYRVLENYSVSRSAQEFAELYEYAARGSEVTSSRE